MRTVDSERGAMHESIGEIRYYADNPEVALTTGRAALMLAQVIVHGVTAILLALEKLERSR